MYTNPTAKAEEIKVSKVIHDLYDYYTQHEDKLPDDYRAIAARDSTKQAVIDYISGMTDGFAIRTYTQLFVPKGWNIL